MKNDNHLNKFVTVATFNHRPEAEGLKSLLLLEDIQAKIKDETNLQRFWFLVAPRANVHVIVPKESSEKAERILHERQAALYLKKAIHCPACSSSAIEYPAATRKNLIPAIASRVLGLLGIVPNKYYCQDCHFTWTDPQTGATLEKNKAADHATVSRH